MIGELKGSRAARIENGYYYWKAKSTRLYGSNESWKKITIDERKDFEIEAAITYVKEKRRTEAAALTWGRSSKGCFYLAFEGNEYRATMWTDRKGEEEITEWTKTPLLKQGNYNKLTIRKVGSTYYLFINEGLVHTMAKTKKFFGDNIGFMTNGIIHVDYLRVSYLEKSAPATGAVAQKAAASQQPPTVATSDSVKDATPATEVRPEPRETTRTLPTITILEPEISRGFKRTPTKMLRVSGKTESPEGVQTVLVNEQTARLESDGRFSTEVPLRVGSNTITVQVKDKRDQVATKTFSVRRESEDSTATARRLALIIGNAHYQNGGSLQNPINDVRAMEAKLKELDFTVLKYEDCSQATIKRAIDDFGQQLAGLRCGHVLLRRARHPGAGQQLPHSGGRSTDQ